MWKQRREAGYGNVFREKIEFRNIEPSFAFVGELERVESLASAIETINRRTMPMMNTFGDIFVVSHALVDEAVRIH